MDMDKKPFVLAEDEYYGPLLYSYIDTILRSGELLEDDFQVILSVYRIEQFFTNQKVHVPYGLITCAASFVPSLLASKKLGFPLLVLPSLVLTTTLAYCKLQELKTLRRHQDLIKKLVEVLKNIQDHNKKINNYLIERKAHSSKYSRDLFEPFTYAISKFMKDLFKKQCDLHNLIISSILEFSNFCEPLKEDCDILRNYQVSTVEFESYKKYTDHVISLQQLLTSKLLSYIAICFCWEQSTINKTTSEELLNYKIPSLVNLLNNYRNNISELFLSLRYKVSRLSARDFQKKSVSKNRISSKLRNALDTSVNNISFVLEKLYNIIDIIEQTEGNYDQRIDQALLDLRNNTAAAYETLDILCKIYGILLDSKKKSEKGNVLICEEEIKSNYGRKSDISQPSNGTDPREQIEDKEKYELFIKATDKIEEPIQNHEESSDVHLQIMIKELKRNLKQHKFYVLAKKRWKDDTDDEPCSSDSDDGHLHLKNKATNTKLGPESSLPTSTEAAIPENSKTTVENKTPLNHYSAESVGEMSQLNVEKIENGSEDELLKRDTSTRGLQTEEQRNWNPILQGIKTFSKNIEIVEETFGEDGDSD